MKALKLLLVIVMISMTALSGCSAKSGKGVSGSSEKSKMLVCYFSATGTTAGAARRIADLTVSDLYEIIPEARYTEADLDWRDSLSRSYVEMHNREFRPSITGQLPDVAQYDVIFIGYPNWWNTHPTVVNTFIEANDFSGKTIVPFMTSGGSNIINSEKELRESYPGLTFGQGLLMNNVTDSEIKRWAEDAASSN